MRVFNNLKELKDAPYPVYVYIRQNIKNNASLAEIHRDMRFKNLSHDDVFDYYLGGKPCIIEETADLSNLTLYEENPETGDWFNILEKPGVFDVVDELEGGWIAFVIISNDSGGNTYFIPEWMKAHCENIQKSITLTYIDQDYSGNSEEEDGDNT